tara:strand:+ start:5261 stop:5836 length:576 start_codon:yes stop_codon:yes gene_type:complete
MNYLGHLVLSGHDEQVIFGNFIADAIKGNTYLEWPSKTQKGILLHRFIDNFTDNNVYYLKGKRRFYKDFPKIGGVVNDIVYDFLLWQYYNDNNILKLNEEIIRFHNVLDKKLEYMPEKIKIMYAYMKRDNWLLNYRYDWGVKKALRGIGNRLNYSNNLDQSFNIVNENIEDFKNEFQLFYSEIRTKVSSFM